MKLFQLYLFLTVIKKGYLYVTIIGYEMFLFHSAWGCCSLDIFFC